MKKVKAKLDTCLQCGTKFRPLYKSDLICNPCREEDKLIDDVEARETVTQIGRDYFGDNYD